MSYYTNIKNKFDNRKYFKRINRFNFCSEKSKELVHVTVTIRVNTNLSNLQELKLYCNNYDLRIFNYNMVFDRFKNSDDSECHEKSLSNLNNNLSTNILNEFLENNGRNLKKFHINKYGYERSICTYCKNIRILKTNLTNNELDVLQILI
ncbi:hypothetical protein RhiirB3_455653 [Rhizophagus irregularis]|nr:hypothetical protein RhiirB3_455653 [Rhizophagus irregularis]